MHDWSYTPPDGYSTLDTTRRRRCASCGELIEIGSVVAVFERRRDARVRRWLGLAAGEDETFLYISVPLAPLFHCERCAVHWFALTNAGHDGIAPTLDVRELVV